MTDKLTYNQVNMAAKIVMVKGDSTASSHYRQENDVEVLSEIKEIIDQSVLLLNKDTIDVTNKG